MKSLVWPTKEGGVPLHNMLPIPVWEGLIWLSYKASPKVIGFVGLEVEPDSVVADHDAFCCLDMFVDCDGIPAGGSCIESYTCADHPIYP